MDITFHDSNLFHQTFSSFWGVQLQSLPVLSDQSAVSSSRASCPARQRELLLSQREGGIYGSMQAGGHCTLLPPFLPTNPFKGRPLCQHAVWDVQQNDLRICISFVSIKIPKPLARQWRPCRHHKLTVWTACAYVNTICIPVAPDHGWPVSLVQQMHFNLSVSVGDNLFLIRFEKERKKIFLNSQ